MNNTTKCQLTSEALDKRIELCVEELSLFLKNKTKPTVKAEENKWNISEDNIETNGLQSTIESISEVLQRDDSDRVYESLFHIILKLKQKIQSIFNFNLNSTKTNFSKESDSCLTFYNVNLNSNWETICYRIEKLIMNDMIRNSLENELQSEKFISQLKFLLQLKDYDGLEIWQIYNSIRVSKLEIEIIDWDIKEFSKSLEKITLLMSFDCKLYKSGYFGSYNISYTELIMPYIQTIKTKYELKVSSLNGDVNNLINLIKTFNEFDEFIQQIRCNFPQIMESPEQNELFDWKLIIENKGNINLFHRTIYNTIDTNLRSLVCFSNNYFVDCKPNQQNILKCVYTIFSNLENYEHLITLDSFMTFLSYAISANISDFFIHHFNNGKFISLLEKYTLLNTIYFMKEQLAKIQVNVEKFVEISDKLIKSIIAKHVSILLLNRNTHYWLLYLKRLWYDLKNKLKNFQNRRAIYIFVLSETVHNYSRIEISNEDTLIILNNIDELITKYACSKNELFFDDKFNIHSSCWLLFVKLVLKITNNDSFISNLKQNDYMEDNITTNSKEHWIQYFKPHLFENSFWLNAKLCLDKESPIDSLLIIRAFLSNDCRLCAYILNDFNQNNKQLSNQSVLDIFKIMTLQNFRPLTFSSIIQSLIENNNEWHEFDKESLHKTNSRIWWYCALEDLLIENIEIYLRNELITLINKSRISLSINEDILDIYKAYNIEYIDIDQLVEHSISSLFEIIFNTIETLPITLIVSLQNLNQSLPKTVNPLSNCLLLNIFVSTISRILQECNFLPQSHITDIEFCQKIRINFLEKLFDSSYDLNEYLISFKKLLESKVIDEYTMNSLINEELEYEMISSLSSDSTINQNMFLRLHSLICEYKDTINQNFSIDQTIGETIIIKLNESQESNIELISETYVNYNYDKLLEKIVWDKFEHQIKSKLDHLSRLSLLQNINH